MFDWILRNGNRPHYSLWRSNWHLNTRSEGLWGWPPWWASRRHWGHNPLWRSNEGRGSFREFLRLGLGCVFCTWIGLARLQFRLLDNHHHWFLFFNLILSNDLFRLPRRWLLMNWIHPFLPGWCILVVSLYDTLCLPLFLVESLNKLLSLISLINQGCCHFESLLKESSNLLAKYACSLFFSTFRN